MACVTTHRTGGVVQGPGLCCSQVASGALAKAIGSVGPATTNAKTGKCGHCEVVASTSRKHPGRPVLRWKFGGTMCPSTVHGCCALVS
jgi:hypothetical protein